MAHAHTPGTAFALTPGSGGTRTRLDGPHIHSPFQWPAGTTPPALASQAGQDLFVETDCEADGDCDGTGDQSHLMVYDTSCGSDPWRNVNTNACRNVTP